MTDREQLIREIEQAPDAIVTELLNLLRHKSGSQSVQVQPQSNQPDLAEISAEADLVEISAEADRPIWELFEAAADDIPNDVLDQLPIDGAAHHDHYLYGTPKNE